MTTKKVNVIGFTDAQLEYLDKLFPETVSYTENPNELYRRMGCRQVVKHIEHLVQQGKIIRR